MRDDVNKGRKKGEVTKRDKWRKKDEHAMGREGLGVVTKWEEEGSCEKISSNWKDCFSRVSRSGDHVAAVPGDLSHLHLCSDKTSARSSAAYRCGVLFPILLTHFTAKLTFWNVCACKRSLLARAHVKRVRLLHTQTHTHVCSLYKLNIDYQQFCQINLRGNGKVELSCDKYGESTSPPHAPGE